MLTLPFAVWSAPAALRVVVTPNYSAPLAVYTKDQLSDGLIFDMSQAIAAQLKMPVQYLYLPRKRLESALASGQADLWCYTNPQWLANNPDEFYWSAPLFKNETIVVGAANAPLAVGMHDLAGQTVGAVLGYSYPTLDEQFAAGTIRREDAPDAAASYEKLIRHRVPYAVVNLIEHDYFLAHSGKREAFNASRVPVNEFALYCALSRESAVPGADFESAVREILRRKLPDTWLAKYR